MTVSVVVPCFNEERHLKALLNALSHQDLPPEEVIVVDGGSTDATVDVFQSTRKEMPHLALKLIVNPGASIPTAVNAGIGIAQGHIIIRLDAHSVPSPNYIASAVTHLQDGSVGVVGGVWKVAAGARSATARAIAQAVSHPLGAGDAAYRTLSDEGPPVDADTVPFGCFQRGLWTKLRGFDELLRANEDYEFNYRVRESGLRVLLDPRMCCVYHARPTLSALARQYFRYGWWKVQMLRKFPLSLRWRQAVPAAFVALIALLSIVGVVNTTAWWLFGGILAMYGLGLGATSLAVCTRERSWSRVPPLVAAFATIHLCWGSGAVLNILTFAQWPYKMPTVRPNNSAGSTP